MKRAGERRGGISRTSVLGAGAFARAAPRYWCSVYPLVRREVALQRRRAAAIPDPRLRRVALTALEVKRANIDGAAAFAAFAPAGARAAVVRAQIAFQAAYDYLDVLTELPHPDPIATSSALHSTLLAAVAQDPHAIGFPGDDRAYLEQTVDRCRDALSELPSYPAVRPAALRLTERIHAYQSFNVADAPGPREALAAWATHNTPAGSGLAWWETAASAGSSLGLFALIAMAARPGATTEQADAVEQAYFPWIGALHSLLDSLIDRAEDEASGQQALIAHYGEPHQIAEGLARLTVESRRRAAALPQPGTHAAILASMVAIYLAEGQSHAPHAGRARGAVLAQLGALGAPALLVMRARRAALAGRIVR